jgi:hypothetical protein
VFHDGAAAVLLHCIWQLVASARVAGRSSQSVARGAVRFMFVRRAGRPRRGRIDWVAKHRRCVVIVKNYPLSSPNYHRSFCRWSMVRSSTKRMAIGRPATAPAMPSLKCSGVHRFNAASTASR